MKGSPFLRYVAVLWCASLLLLGAVGLAVGLETGTLQRLVAVGGLVAVPVWALVLRLLAPWRVEPPPAIATHPEAAPPALPTSPPQPDVALLREQQLLAERDPLTGCLNRRALLERLSRMHAGAGREADSLTCGMLEIDDFAALGLRYGQEVSDRLLGLAAQVARDNLRDIDLLGRWGGAQFCIVLPGIGADAALRVAERIRVAFADASDNRFTSDMRLTMSGGVAGGADGASDAQGLVALSARALERAQAQGANRILRWSRGDEELDRGASAGARAAQQLVEPRTGLPGQDVFRERVEHGVQEAIRAQRTVAVVLFGVGLAEGAAAEAAGEARIQLSVRLRNALRAIDAVAVLDAGPSSRPGLCALFGLLLSDLPDPRMAANIVRRVCAQVSEPVEIGEAGVGLVVSAGVALAPADGSEPAALVAAAGKAMEAAQARAGRIRCEFVAPEMNQVYVDQERFRAELQQALAGDELELHYLPRIELATGRVSGLEALVRWNHPVRGQLQPGQFIATAETAGMIVPLGNWVLAQAIAAAAGWRQAGYPELVVCVNLSPFQFRQLNLVELTGELLERHGLEARCLEIEISESSVIRNTEAAVSLINRLNRGGVRIAIDDFGTGYAVLKYLRRFPANTVKIDRALVTGVHRDNRDATIVSAIVSLAGSLGIHTVAEGVENEEQQAALRALGCPAAQGFLYSRPLPAADLPAYLAANRV